MSTYFSRHAFGRVSKRLNLTPKEVAGILDKGLFVPLGKDGLTTKIHKLFFSETDLYWFVAVQDELNDEVVTVLPIEYHNRWRVSFDALEQARLLIVEKKKAEPMGGSGSTTASGSLSAHERKKVEPAKELGEATFCGPSVFRFSAILTDLETESKIRTVNLGSIPCGAYPTIYAATEDPKIQVLLRNRLSEKIYAEEALVYFQAQIGNKGFPVPVWLPAPS